MLICILIRLLRNKREEQIIKYKAEMENVVKELKNNQDRAKKQPERVTNDHIEFYRNELEKAKIQKEK